jgi:pyruvate dehydrogenase (quinone)
MWSCGAARATFSGTPATTALVFRKLNHPDRPVIALVGDGAMQLDDISILITVAQR